MTNYEQLLQAKTKEEMRKALYSFGAYLLKPNSALDIDEWLDQEAKSEKQVFIEGLMEVLFSD